MGIKKVSPPGGLKSNIKLGIWGTAATGAQTAKERLPW
jgi:hypothetical protein